MTTTGFDWQHHISAFRASGKTVHEYCSETGLVPDRFKYQLYKKPAKDRRVQGFSEFTVERALVISRDDRGRLTITGFDTAQLPQIVGAWNDALS